MSGVKYLDELLSLDFPVEKYVIFGSGPLAVWGIRDNEDIDVVVIPDYWDQLAEKYQSDGDNCIVIGNVSIYRDLLPFSDDASKIIENAEMIDGLPFARLEYVIQFKKMMGREKDIKDIELIEAFLRDLS